MNREQIIDALEPFEPFDRLEYAELEVLAGRAELIQVRAGSRVFDQGGQR
jgi:hypothetical protein